jgi:hypothetical protein
MTSPPVVIGDVVVVGSSTDDNSRAEMPSGIVRGFDARTGAQLSSWKPLLPPAQNPTSDTSKLWRTGAGNAWTMTADPEHGLVFVPTGSAGPDYNGGLRLGDNKWANSVVALRDKAGELAWGFQLVHHDLGDYDTASPPLLATINHDGRDIPVVIQGNKTGMLYFLNRDADLPVFGVQERPVPQSDVAGEAASPTQPFPLAPPPLVPQKLPITDVWGVTPEEREAVRARLQPLRNEGVFTPPSVEARFEDLVEICAVGEKAGPLLVAQMAQDAALPRGALRPIWRRDVRHQLYDRALVPLLHAFMNHRPAVADVPGGEEEIAAPKAWVTRDFAEKTVRLQGWLCVGLSVVNAGNRGMAADGLEIIQHAAGAGSVADGLGAYRLAEKDGSCGPDE